MDARFHQVDDRFTKRLGDVEDRFTKSFGEFKQQLVAVEERLVEQLRDSETKLLRGFYQYQGMPMSGCGKCRPTFPIWTPQATCD